MTGWNNLTMEILPSGFLDREVKCQKVTKASIDLISVSLEQSESPSCVWSRYDATSGTHQKIFPPKKGNKGLPWISFIQVPAGTEESAMNSTTIDSLWRPSFTFLEPDGTFWRNSWAHNHYSHNPEGKLICETAQKLPQFFPVCMGWWDSSPSLRTTGLRVLQFIYLLGAPWRLLLCHEEQSHSFLRKLWNKIRERDNILGNTSDTSWGLELTSPSVLVGWATCLLFTQGELDHLLL